MLATSLHPDFARTGLLFAVSTTPLQLGQQIDDTPAVSAEDMDMRRPTRITEARASHSRDEDGRWTAQMLALSMGLFFGLILVLQAYTW
jgi:hypothetical protein